MFKWFVFVLLFMFCILDSNSLAEAVSVSSLGQMHYRWRRDDGSETTASWRKAEDQILNPLKKNETIRLRFVSERSPVGDTSDVQYHLRYSSSSGGISLKDVPVTATSGEAFEMATTGYTDQEATTQQLSSTAGYTFVSGQSIESPSNQTNTAITLPTSSVTEIEFAIQATDDAIAGQTYYLRLHSDFNPELIYREAKVVIAPDALTSTWDGSASTDWDEKLNWDTEIVPRSTGNDSAVIASTANQPILSTASTITDLTLNSGAALNLNDNNLTVSGSITNAGIITETANGVIVHAADSVLLTNSSGTEVSTYQIGADQVYVRIDDGDENLDGTAIDTLVGVTVTGGTNGDSEVLTLKETGVATGVFMNTGLTTKAYDGLVSSNDGILELSEGEVVTASYIDSEDASDSSGTDTTSANFAAASFSVSAAGSQVVDTGFSMTITALDSLGRTDVYYNGQITLTPNYVVPSSGSGSLSSVTDFSFVNGVATVSDQTYSNCGKINIVATDSKNTAMTGTSADVTFAPYSFNVSAEGVDTAVTGALSHTVNKGFPLVVTAQNASGGACTGYQGNPVLSVDYVNPSSSQSGMLSLTNIDSTTWKSGAASLSDVTYDKWGAVTFTVTDDNVTTQKGTSEAVTFVPKDFQLSLSEPPVSRTFYYMNEPFDLTVTARDYNNNTLTNYAGSIKFTQTGLDLSDNYTFVSLDEGVHVFNGIKGIEAVKAKSIEVKDSDYTSIVGSSEPVTIKEAYIKVHSNEGPVGDLPLSVTIIDGEGNIITEDDMTTFSVNLEEFINDNSATSETTETVEIMSGGKASIIVNDNQAETITVTAESEPVLPAISGKATFGTVSGRGIGVQMYREIKD